MSPGPMGHGLFGSLTSEFSVKRNAFKQISVQAFIAHRS